MKSTTLFTAALLVAAGGVLTNSARSASEASVATAVAAQDTASFETLAADYDKAAVDFKKRLSEADKKERKALRANHPINEYWPRFEAMGQAGEGRALLWLADNIRTNRGIKASKRGEALKPIYSALAANHVNADWFKGALTSFQRDARVLGPDATMATIDAMLASAKGDKATAGVLFFGAGAIEGDNPEKAAAMIKRISDEFSDTRYAQMMRAKDAKPSDSEVGKIAPNFLAESLDGFEFSLEDYRGKVTVLDFYGFW